VLGLTPLEQIVSRALDVVASVSPETIKRNQREVRHGVSGLSRTQVDPRRFLELYELLEEHYPGALDRIRRAGDA
jgi:hypothetical protein